MSNNLNRRFPLLAERLPRIPLAELPTPLSQRVLETPLGRRTLRIKHDERSGSLYGGNKVRKLEYLLRRAGDRQARRVATFGTVASNHALATALYARACGFACTCLLSHQAKTPYARRALSLHLGIGTELVYFGGDRTTRIATMRRYLQGRHTWVVPMGGSSWLGTVGFVNAGIELADQLSTQSIAAPDRIYVANGTMGTAAGLALGLALAGIDAEVHAVRVTDRSIANPGGLRRLIGKTATLLNRLDPEIPADIGDRARLCFRDEFFAGGYALSDSRTDHAVRVARDALGLELEPTYTGKAMAALLHDLGEPANTAKSMLFWNTYNARPMAADTGRPADASALPEAFRSYFD